MNAEKHARISELILLLEKRRDDTLELIDWFEKHKGAIGDGPEESPVQDQTEKFLAGEWANAERAGKLVTLWEDLLVKWMS